VSSSGHLAIVSRIFFAGDAGASFTAVSQLGTEAAVLVYFARDIARILKAWLRGLFKGLAAKSHRNTDYRLGWYVIIGRFGQRLAEFLGRQSRHIKQLNWRDALVVGVAQTLALIPGASRWGSTISAGLFLGLDRELAARFGFLLAIPAVFAAGLFSIPDALHPATTGMSATGSQLVAATLIAFVIGLAAVAWLLRFLVRHSMYWFVGYRVVAGVAVLIQLGNRTVAAT
jgi:undecaprenyl-diphosphatase